MDAWFPSLGRIGWKMETQNYFYVGLARERFNAYLKVWIETFDEVMRVFCSSGEPWKIRILAIQPPSPFPPSLLPPLSLPPPSLSLPPPSLSPYLLPPSPPAPTACTTLLLETNEVCFFITHSGCCPPGRS